MFKGTQSAKSAQHGKIAHKCPELQNHKQILSGVLGDTQYVETTWSQAHLILQRSMQFQQAGKTPPLSITHFALTIQQQVVLCASRRCTTWQNAFSLEGLEVSWTSQIFTLAWKQDVDKIPAKKK